MKRVHRLPENMQLNKVYWCQIDQKIFNFLVAPLRFFPLEKQPKNINFQSFFYF